MSVSPKELVSSLYADPALQGKVRKAIRGARKNMQPEDVDDLAQSAWTEVFARVKDGRLTDCSEAVVCRIAMQVAVEETGLAVSRRTIDRIREAEAALGFTGAGPRPSALAVDQWTHTTSSHPRDWVSAESVTLARLVVGQLTEADERMPVGAWDPFEELLEEGAALYGRIERGEPSDRTSLALLAYLVTATVARGRQSRGEKREFSSTEIARILGVSAAELRKRKAVLGAHIATLREEIAA